MKLHLPLSLLAAVTLAFLGANQAEANNLTSVTTSINEDVTDTVSAGNTYSGYIFTFLPTATYNGSTVTSVYNANAQGYNIAGSSDNTANTYFAQFNTDGTSGAAIASRDTPAIPGGTFWHTYCSGGTGSSSHGHTLRLASNAADMDGKTDVKIGGDFGPFTLGGLIVEDTDVNWTVGRTNGSSVKLRLLGSATSGVNLTIASNTALNGASGIDVETSGAWEVAAGKTLTFNQATSIYANKEVNISRLKGDTDGNVRFNGTLALNAGATLDIGANTTVTAVGNISGTDTSTIAVSGTLSGTLVSGTVKAGTSTGTLKNFTLNGGTLDFGSGVLAASGNITIQSGTLLYSGLSNEHIGQSYDLITGTGLTWNDDIFNGELIFNNGTVESDGSFIFTQDGHRYIGALHTSDTGMTVALEDVLRRDAALSLTWAGNDTNSTWNNAQGNNTWNDGASETDFVRADSVTFDDTAANKVVTIEGTVIPASITIASGDYTFTGSGSLEGHGNMSIASSASLSLGTDNTGWHGTLENNGTLTIAHVNAVADATLNVADGGTLGVADGIGTVQANGSFAGAATVNLNGQTLDWRGTTTAGSLITLDSATKGGKLMVNQASALFSSYNLGANTTLALNVDSGTITTTFTSANTLGLSGSGTIEKTGAGTWVLDNNTNSQTPFGGNANFSGNVVVSGGTLRLGGATGDAGANLNLASNVLGTGTFTIKDGATLQISLTQTGGNVDGAEVANNITLEGGSTLAILDGKNRLTGTVKLEGNATIKTSWGKETFIVNKLEGANHTLTHANHERDGILNIAGANSELGKLVNNSATVKVTGAGSTIGTVETKGGTVTIGDGVSVTTLTATGGTTNLQSGSSVTSALVEASGTEAKLQLNNGTHTNVGLITIRKGNVQTSTSDDRTITLSNGLTIENEDGTPPKVTVSGDAVTYTNFYASHERFCAYNSSYTYDGTTYTGAKVSGATINVDNDYWFQRVDVSESNVIVGEEAVLDNNVGDSTVTYGTLTILKNGKITNSNTQSSSKNVFTGSINLTVGKETFTYEEPQIALLSVNVDDYATGYSISALEGYMGTGSSLTLNFSDGLISDSVDKIALSFTGLAADTGTTLDTSFFTVNGWNVDDIDTEGGTVLYISRAIPEPTTATLSLLALAGLAARRRRK